MRISYLKYFYILLIVFILSMLGSFAFFSWESGNSDNTNVSFDVVADTVYIYYDAGSNINGGDLYPTDDKNDGISKDITVKISGVVESKPVAFNLYLDLTDVPEELMDDSFKWALYNGSEELGTGSITKNITNCTENNTRHIVLFSNNITTVEKQNYTLYLWIDGNMTNPDTMMNKSFKVNLHADGTNATLIEGNSMSLISLERNGGNNVNITLQSLMYNFDSYAISGDGTTEPTSWTDMGCSDNSCNTNDRNVYQKTLNNVDLVYVNGLSYVWLKDVEGRIAKIEIGKNYIITLNNNSATTAGTTTIYGIYKDGFYKDSSYKEKYEINDKITVPTKTNYIFKGYYDPDDKMVIDSEGNFVFEMKSLYYDDITLNAKWVEIDKKAPIVSLINSSGGNWTNKNVNVTLNYSDDGSGINASSLQYSTDNINWISIENTSLSGYTDTWYDERNSTVYYKICDNAGNCSTTSTIIKIDKTSPTLTLGHNDGAITITSDTNNIYSNFSPGGNTHDSNGNGTTNETTITNVSSSEPGPVSDSITWKLETSGSDNPQWIGWQGHFGNIFNGNANDIIMISGYYKSSQLNGISEIVSSTLYKSDWSMYSTTTIEDEEDMIEDGQWHYFHQTFRVNEAFSNAIIGWAPAFGYSTKKRTLYINGLNWRIVPSSNTTATDIHIRKWASGSQSLSYFQNGGGTQISGNSFQITSPGTYTVYVEDTAGNGTIKTIDVYSISYDLDGGSVSGNPSYYDKTTSSITINSPTKSGIQFLGWYGSNDASSGLNGYTSSNTYTASGRDHILGNDFNVSEGEKFRVFVTAKRTSGSLDLQGGIWYTEYSSGASYDGYGGSFSEFETLSNGYAKYYKDITIPSGKTKGKFYIQIEQDASGGDTTWSLYDMHAIKIDSKPTIPKGSTGNKSYTANWLTSNTLTINKGTGVSKIYYKVNGASSYSSTSSNVSVSVTSGTTYYYYGTASTGYTINSCTSSSPCSGTMGTSSVSKSLSATINSYYLDLNGYLDNSNADGIDGYGTADIYINGSLVCDDCTDYYQKHPYGSSYEIKDIKSTTGHTYNGVHSGNLSGTIPDYNYTIRLNYSSNTYYIYFNANGGSGAPDTQSYIYSTTGTITLSSTTPSKNGYNFLGWSTSSTAGSPSYYAGGSFSKTTASNTTLYAVWGLPTGIYEYRGVETGYYEEKTKDFLYITTCDNSNAGNCNYTAKNADSSNGTITRSKLRTEVTGTSNIATTSNTTTCNSTSCSVYIFTEPGLTSTTAGNKLIGVLKVNEISTDYPVYKTSSKSGKYRKVYFSYNTADKIIQSFHISYYAYGAGIIQKISYKGDWYFGWVDTNYAA